MKPKFYKSDNRVHLFGGILVALILLALIYYIDGSKFILLFAFSFLSIFVYFESEYFIKNGRILRKGIEQYAEFSYQKINYSNAQILNISEITKIKKIENVFGSKGLEFFVGKYSMMKLYLKKRDEFLKELLKNNSKIEVL